MLEILAPQSQLPCSVCLRALREGQEMSMPPSAGDGGEPADGTLMQRWWDAPCYYVICSKCSIAGYERHECVGDLSRARGTNGCPAFTAFSLTRVFACLCSSALKTI